MVGVARRRGNENRNIINNNNLQQQQQQQQQQQSISWIELFHIICYEIQPFRIKDIKTFSLSIGKNMIILYKELKKFIYFVYPIIINLMKSLSYKQWIYSFTFIILYYLSIYIGFGIVFLLISSIIMIFTIGLDHSDGRNNNILSAYSVFNKGCETILGTLTAEQFEREIMRNYNDNNLHNNMNNYNMNNDHDHNEMKDDYNNNNEMKNDDDNDRKSNRQRRITGTKKARNKEKKRLKNLNKMNNNDNDNENDNDNNFVGEGDFVADEDFDLLLDDFNDDHED